ncbi:MAG: hypothetical protein A2139_00065 [Desulfobacca sp. RBG_16_60_12]|nr:MAG: hypothetical protein A2139_00065 [Desulfobacca sp. RBG_16_60_12]
MQTLIKYLAVLALAVNICLPGVASAYITGGTWMETGAETGSAAFTKIEVFADAATTLTDVVLYGFSASTWTNTLVNAHYSVAQGTYTGSVTFTWQFPDPGSQYREIEYLVWNGDTLLSTQHLAFNQYGWYVPAGTGSWGYYPGDGVNDFYNDPLPSSSHAPIPASLVLLGTGLVGLIGLRRKSRRGKKDDPR